MEDIERESTGSTDSSSSDQFSNNDDTSKVGDKEEDVEIEDNEEVNHVKDPAPEPVIALPTQIPIVKPILVFNLASDIVDDLSFPMVLLALEDLIEHSFNQSNHLGYNSEGEVDMDPK